MRRSPPSPLLTRTITIATIPGIACVQSAGANSATVKAMSGLNKHGRHGTPYPSAPESRLCPGRSLPDQTTEVSFRAER